MKLYRVPAAAPGERWQRTQDDARATAKPLVLAGTISPAGAWSGIDVPTDARGLIAYLNAFEDETIKLHGERTERLPAPPVEVRTVAEPTLPDVHVAVSAAPVRATPTALDLTTVEEFIQSANAAQLARLADNVCWRMKELVAVVQESEAS